MRLALLLVVACSGKDHMTSEAMEKPKDSPPVTAPRVDTVPDLATGCAAYAKAQCAALAKCSPNSVALAWAPGGCEPALERECKLSYALPGSGVTNESLARCATWSATQCPLDRSGGECANPDGRFANGAACISGIQCESGACKRSRHTDECGVCAPKPNDRPPQLDRGPGLGAACKDHCGDGLLCDKGKCIAPKARGAGETCTRDMLGFAAGPDPCGPGLSCVGGDKPTCEKRPADGEACRPDGARCLFPATCRDGTCKPPDPARCK